MITAKELIDLIVSTKPTAKVENDEDLYVKPQGEIEVDDDGLCTLAVHTETGGLDMGNFRFEVGGVDVSVSRELDGPGDDYEFNELQDGSWVSRDDLGTGEVIKAITENVKFPPYNEMQYNDVNFDPDDVESSISVDANDVYAEDGDGDVYCYSDKDEVPADQTVIAACAAVHKLVETWSEDGGEADGMMIESFGPWG